jgi:hypothetical protein
MDMQSFLNEIEHAVVPVIASIWGESERVRLAEAAVKASQLAIDENLKRMKWLDDNPDLDDDGLGTLLKWDTYFDAEPALDRAQQILVEATQRMLALKFSRGALSGTLLQFAKQGISIVHGARGDAPRGRVLAPPEVLRDIIWEARNHALHWEDGEPRAAVVRVFTALEANYPGSFAAFRKENTAFEVVEVLGWRNWSSFANDLLTLK